MEFTAPTPQEIIEANAFLHTVSPAELEAWRASTVESLMASGQGKEIIEGCFAWLKSKGPMDFIRNRDVLIQGFVGGSLSSAFQLGLICASLQFAKKGEL